MKVKAPWTYQQARFLAEWQTSPVFHPFTCPNDGRVLLPFRSGWLCPAPTCDYKQDWAHDFMLSGEYLDPAVDKRQPRQQT